MAPAADPIAHLALALGLLLVAARLGGEVAARLEARWRASQAIGEVTPAGGRRRPSS